MPSNRRTRLRSRESRSASEQPIPPDHSYRDFGLLLLLAAAGVLYRPALALVLFYGLWRLASRLFRPETILRLRVRLELLPRDQVRLALVITGIAGTAILLAWLIARSG